MINANCHGCKQPMNFEAVPVTLIDITGNRQEHWGKNSAAWICPTCRQDPKKLKAARVAAGLSADVEREGFDADYVF